MRTFDLNFKEGNSNFTKWNQKYRHLLFVQVENCYYIQPTLHVGWYQQPCTEERVWREPGIWNESFQQIWFFSFLGAIICLFLISTDTLGYVSCTLDRFTKELFWNFKECQVVSMEAYQDKQMSEKKFFPNVVPSPGSGTKFQNSKICISR